MSRLIRYLIDLLYKQYILEHMPLSHTEIIHAQPCSFAFEKNTQLAHFLSMYYSVYLCRYLSFRACIEFPDFTNKNKGCWVKFSSFPEGFPGGSEVKVSACNAKDPVSIPGLGRSPGEGNGNPLQYSCLENPMERGAWWATVHAVTKSWTQLSDFTFRQTINNFLINYVPNIAWTYKKLNLCLFESQI